jgi:predicted FMN-binding regulatory protein PaiB
VSASWYADDTIPTWNHVTLHVRGTPELFDDALPVLAKLSQDKPDAEQRNVLEGLEADGPYRNPPLAAAMRGTRLHANPVP